MVKHQKNTITTHLEVIMSKTAIQQLITWSETASRQSIIDKYNYLLEVEKQQILNAHMAGQPLYSCQSEKAEQYYNETYGGQDESK